MATPPPPVFLPGESHGQRSLTSYSHWGHKELDTTERLHFHFSLMCSSEVKVTQSCPTFHNCTDYTLPGFSVHGIFQAIVLECIAISFSRGSSQTRD